MDKFQNTYRIPSSRMQQWDYRWAGAYFITICTKDKQHYFGEIENENMKLSDLGILADLFWHEITNHTKNVELGEFAVMPNHIHGILILNAGSNGIENVETLHATSPHLTYPHAETLHAETLRAMSLPMQYPINNKHMSNISPKPNSISAIIRSYKSAVTKHVHRLGLEFQWQERFHDHIIRDDNSFQTITNYIINNPANWQADKFYNETPA